MKKYQARVDHREFLNLPGFNHTAHVYAYVEDTSEREACDGTKQCSEYNYIREHRDHEPHNFDPRMILEMSDCDKTISLDFDIDSAQQRQNSFHKIDTLIKALTDFRQGMVEECALYRKREKLTNERAEEYHNKRKEKNKH
jgi:hypothetical protein